MRDAESTVLLTGAAQGIGRATARLLVASGRKVGLVDRAEGPLAELVAELGGASIASAVADVRDKVALRAAVRGVESALGPIGVLVASAGVGGLSTALDLDTDALRAMLEVNVLGVAHAIEAVLPGMFARGCGHVVALSSVAGFRGMPWMPGYSASKAALSTYLEGLRPALKRRGVAITNVCPGFVRTGLTAGTPFARPIPMMEPERAAREVVAAIRRRPRDHVFPLDARLGMGLLRRLPNWAYDRMMDHAGPRALTTEF